MPGTFISRKPNLYPKDYSFVCYSFVEKYIQEKKFVTKYTVILKCIKVFLIKFSEK